MGRSRATPLLTLVPVAYALVMVAASCTTFDTDPPVADAASESASEGAPIDAGAAPDGAPSDDGAARAALAPVCPPPPGGNDTPGTWKRRPLFLPPPGPKMFPFAIATDATHVTWVAQVAAPNADNPYDGVGDGMILRVAKDGTSPPVTLATSQRFARGLALDGIYAYWVTYGESNIATLMRTPRDCLASCPAPEPRTTFPSGVRIDRLARAVPGVLFASSDSGQLFRIEADAQDAKPKLVYTAGDNAGLAVTTSHAYSSAMQWPQVGGASVDGGAGANLFLIAPEDAAPKGVVPIATDCTKLWMIRELPAPQVLAFDLGASSPALSLLPERLPIGAFDLAADAKWLYFGAANAGGLFYVDKNTGGSTLMEGGNVWRIAVDRDGVYFGEHDRNTGTGNLVMYVAQ